MNMLPLSEPFRPHLNFDDAINRAICLSEIEGGVTLDELPVGAALDVQTANTLYRLENRGDGEVLISGHPEICPEPVLVNFHGSTWGTPMLKVRFIGREMRMEFFHPEKGIVRTSRVRDIRERTVSHIAEGELIRKAS
ncbi:MAG TPA: hypothetical protein VGQ49_03455 [Bryobacteraceae bacterium]|jgi:hypothetical protein|nr:hypothetical protein [Bryobacteraceae bacterium]